jgi:hypothetical protein
VIKPAHFLVPQLSNSVASKTIGDIIQRIGLTALLVFVVSDIVSMLVIGATLPFGEEKGSNRGRPEGAGRADDLGLSLRLRLCQAGRRTLGR